MPGEDILVQSLKADTYRSAPQSKPVAITVKLDSARYEKLKLHGLHSRISNQEIMVAAFDLYMSQQS